MSTIPLLKVARPRVTITPTHGRYIATCQHCTWRYDNTIKSDVEWQARNHRAHHRAGIGLR